MTDYKAFWGKARPEAGGAGPGWHPLVYHMADVAAVGDALLAARPFLMDRLVGLSGIAAVRLRPWLLFAMAAHDLGKFSAPFQMLRADLVHDPALRAWGSVAAPRHDRIGVEAWRRCIGPRLFDNPPRRQGHFIDLLIISACGHHGRPTGNEPFDLASAFPEASRVAAQTTLAEFFTVFGPKLDGDWPRQEARNRFSWLFAGLCMVADHVGSNTDWFAYHEPALSLDAYWAEIAQPRAAAAIKAAGLAPAKANPPGSVRDLVPHITRPTPLQHWAATVEIDDRPALWLIEEETGAGKTEAAILLAQRLIAAGQGEGIHLALPTLATANAMEARLRKVVTGLFDPHAKPPVTVLNHSARDIAPLVTNYADDTERAETMRGLWAQDDRRRAFFADFGVGTIDQALLAVLPAKYQGLRLAGLAGRVLIIDEIHAYDAFTLGLIGRLLTFLGAFGVPVIAMSATLPASARQALVAAYGAKGAPGADAPYPMALKAEAARVCVTALSPARDPQPVKVARLENAQAAIARLKVCSKEGQPAVWIRNTVADAQAAAAALAKEGIAVALFHSRFALCDRLARESELLACFGPDSPNRQGIVVATQVIEMSLDVDFDVMISDLAPIDALIQRAGRLWRHRHRTGRSVEDRVLQVLGPAAGDTVEAGWYRGALGHGAALVYADHARLWRTMRRIEEEGGLRPGRGQVELVYDEGDLCDVPAPLHDTANRREGKDRAQAALASANALSLDKGYQGSNANFTEDAELATRWNDQQSKQWRLARWDGQTLQPWAPETWNGRALGLYERWRLSETGVPLTRCAELRIDDPALSAAIEAIRKAEPDRAFRPEILPVQSETGAVIGTGKAGAAALTYHATVGLHSSG